MANSKVIWGVGLLPLALYLVIFAPMPVFSAVAYAAMVLGILEFCKMALPDQPAKTRVFAVIVGAAVGATYYIGNVQFVFLAIISAFLAILVYALFFEHNTDVSLNLAAKLCMGLLYVPVLFGFVIMLKGAQAPTNVNWLVPLFLLVWINDAGAYFTGRALGKHPLFPRISPKKTIEGSIGGLVASVAAAFCWLAVLRYLVNAEELTGFFTWTDALWIGLTLGVIGPVGDLVESMLKRASGVKDSGNLIPGHGGILDRTDSIIFAAPFLYFFVYFRYLAP